MPWPVNKNMGTAMKGQNKIINKIAMFVLLVFAVSLGTIRVQAADRSGIEKSLQSGMVGEAELFWCGSIGVDETAELKNGAAAGNSGSQTDSAAAESRSLQPASEETTGYEPGSLVMTNVVNTLNVREEPSEEADRVGYLYADCGGTILEHRDGWTKLESGELVGWASDEYLMFGEEAIEEAEAVGRTMARVTGETLRIRKEPSTEAGVYGLAAKGEMFEVLGEAELEFSGGIEFDSQWAAVDFEGQTGYISADYVEISFEYDTGETLEQIKEREEEEKAAKRAENIKNSTVQTEAVRANAGGIPAGTSDVVLLAALVQCEAGGENYEGQLAVASVVANRVRSGAYPNTVSGVIFASGQFSPAGSGKLARVIESGNIKESCLQAATEALAGVTNIGNATRFRRAGSREGIIIGNHVFW